MSDRLEPYFDVEYWAACASERHFPVRLCDFPVMQPAFAAVSVCPSRKKAAFAVIAEHNEYALLWTTYFERSDQAQLYGGILKVADMLSRRSLKLTIGFDPAEGSSLWRALRSSNRFNLVEYPFNNRALSEPMKKMRGLIDALIIHHCDHPVTNMAVKNTAAQHSANGDVRPVAINPETGIRGVVAALAALGLFLSTDSRLVHLVAERAA